MNSNVKRTEAGAALTEAILDLFKLNGRMLVAGDRLVAPIGLTSARWQVLGTIAANERSQPVAWIARDMGGNRQNVQRVVNDLALEGMVTFEPNPHHRRAQLVRLTSKGAKAFELAMEAQIGWVNDLTQGLEADDIRKMHAVARELRNRLDSAQAAPTLLMREQASSKA